MKNLRRQWVSSYVVNDTMSITYERMFGNWKNVLQFAAGQDVSRNVRSGK